MRHKEGTKKKRKIEAEKTREKRYKLKIKKIRPDENRRKDIE